MINKKFLAKLFTFTLVIFMCIISTQGCGAKSTNLKFAQISDVHLSTFEQDTSFKLLSSTSDLFDDAILQVNRTPDVDFVMFTGDMINKPLEKELMCFIKHANLLTPPWYMVYGNHDIAHDGTLTKQKVSDIIVGHNKNFCYRTPYYSFTPKKGYKVIGLDTIIDYRKTSQGEIYDDELIWLKDELDNSKGDIVIIFTHVPVIEPYPSEQHRLINSYELKLLLKKYDNPIIVCSGHYHTTKIIQEDNVLYVCTPSLASYPNAFRIINISPKRSKVLVDIYLKETNLKNLQTKAKNGILNGVLLYGSEQDRNNTIELPQKRDRNSL